MPCSPMPLASVQTNKNLKGRGCIFDPLHNGFAPPCRSSKGKQVFSSFRFFYFTRNFIIMPWSRYMPALAAPWERAGNALWIQVGSLMHPGCPARAARLPGAHAGAPRRNAGLAVGRPGTDGVGCQYYQPTCVTVTDSRSPFIPKASQAIPCHRRQCDSPRGCGRQCPKARGTCRALRVPGLVLPRKK